MNAFSARSRPNLPRASASTTGIRLWLHAILDDPAPRPTSDLVCGVVARGRQTVQEIQVCTFTVPRLWSRSGEEEEEDTQVEGLGAS